MSPPLPAADDHVYLGRIVEGNSTKRVLFFGVIHKPLYASHGGRGGSVSGLSDFAAGFKRLKDRNFFLFVKVFKVGMGKL